MPLDPSRRSCRRVVALLAFVAVGASMTVASCGSGSDSSGSNSTAADPNPATTDPDRPDLDGVLAPILSETEVPGLGVAVVSREGVVDLAVAGVQDLDGGEVLDAGDPFHLGSNTKAMTAALLGRLVDADAGLTFDSTLEEVFGPAFEVHEGYAAVTMADLLAHAGGAPTDDEATVDLDELDGSVSEQRLQATEQVLAEAPAVEPGTEFRYSNAGYVIAGTAMEVATGRSWEDLVRAELFEPLGMGSCGFGAPGDDGVPQGHDADGQPTTADSPELLGPAGAVHCSLEDWARFVQELMLAADGQGTWLTAETAERLLSTHPVPVDEGLSAGLGWMIEQGPNGPVYSYDGSNTYWFSQALMVPDRGRALLGVSNQESTGEQAVPAALAETAGMYPA